MEGGQLHRLPHGGFALNTPRFDRAPFLVIWETTHACDLACVHCRAKAEPEPAHDELTREEGYRLIEQVKEMGTPILVFSGGDPLKRIEIDDWVHRASFLGLRTGVIPAATPLLTPERIERLQDAGLDQIAFSLDAADPAEHDSFRRVEGVFARTLEAVRHAHGLGLHVQINSLVNVHNTDSLDRLIGLIERLPIVFWEVFFLVPTGRGSQLPLLSAQKFEEAFEKIHDLSRRTRFVIKVTEAPHYRRYVHQRSGLPVPGTTAQGPRLAAELRRPEGPGGSIGHAPGGVNAGKGFCFVSYRGDVFPSGFLAVSGGSVREKPLFEIYRDSPVFRQLRDASLLKGRCGRCEYREICGGSRSRAWAMTGDYLGEDPCCVYEPSSASVS